MAAFDGGPGNETYVGTDDADTIRGGGGDDVLSGLGGDDFINGDDGNDVIEGDDGTNDLRGGAGMDIISSSGLGDTIFAGHDDDQVVIRGTLGAPVSGGEGQDTLTFDNASFGPDSGSATFSGFESVSITGRLAGTAADDRLDLSTLSSLEVAPSLEFNISAGTGADKITSAQGLRQIIRGGAGNDEIISHGRDRVYGDAGADFIMTYGSNEAFGGDGDDVIETTAVGANLFGGDGNDRLTGGDGGPDDLYGGNGDDNISGRAGNDELFGGLGRDFLFGNDDGDKLTVEVDASNDHDALIGGGGNDVIRAGYGDRIDGGEGQADTLYLDLTHAPNPIRFTFGPMEGATLVFGDRAITGIEVLAEVAGSSFADEITVEIRGTRVRGGAGDDEITANTKGRLVGDAGNDTLSLVSGGVANGGEGDDHLLGAAAGDRLFGGDDGDFAEGFNGSDLLNGGEGNDRLAGGEGNDQMGASYRGSGLLMLREIGDDTIDGGGGDDYILGDVGNDHIIGGSGRDSLYGGDGDDLVEGDTFDREVWGGAGNDTLSLISSQSGAYVDLGRSRYDEVAGFENAIGSSFNDRIFGTKDANSLSGGDGNDSLSGSGGEDRLAGEKGDDALFGGDGDDQLLGGDGTDTMTGGLGDDIYSVLALSDVVAENAGGGYDTVLAGINYLLTDEIEQLNLLAGVRYGRGNELDNRLVGNNGGVTLEGAAGADELLGGSGDDRLNGGLGLDVSRGRGGADLFMFDDGETGATSPQADVIADFSRAQGDRINLRAVDANEATPDEDQNFTFIGSGAFSGEARELRYETQGGDTYVYGDTDGDAVADLVIRIDGNHVLQAGDFVL